MEKRILGAFAIVSVCLACTTSRAEAGLTEISISRGVEFIDGVQSPWSPYFVRVSVSGSDLASVAMVTPAGHSYDLWKAAPGVWIYQKWFDAPGQLSASFAPGSYQFVFDDGADSATVGWDVPAPAGPAQITSPGLSEYGVDANPTCEWASAAGAGDVLALHIACQGTVTYRAFPVDISNTSWQPGPLAAGREYEFGVAVVNLHGGGAQPLTTAQGQHFTYYGRNELVNLVWFTTLPELAVWRISIIESKDHLNGMPVDLPFGVRVAVDGEGITLITVTDPHGLVHDLPPVDAPDGPAVQDMPRGPWQLEERFDSLAELNAAWGPGEYTFTFNDGQDTAVIDYQPIQPAGFATITNPAHNQHGVGSTPVFQWEPAQGLGTSLAMLIIEDPAGKNWPYAAATQDDITATTWDPWEWSSLLDDTPYRFKLMVRNRQQDNELHTSGGLTFQFLGAFDYSNAVDFDTRHRRLDGDVNNDCKVNIIDLIAVRNKINADAATGDNWWADVNNDGKINVVDMIYVRNRLNNRCEE